MYQIEPLGTIDRVTTTNCSIPVIVYYGPSAINYQITINNITTSGSLFSGGVMDMDYDSFSKRLFYYTFGNFYSIEQDGSDLRTVATVANVDRFTVDGRNNIIYYINTLIDNVYMLNMTNSIETDVGIRAKDIDMDAVNDYLVIVKTSTGNNIERYNVDRGIVDALKSGGDFPQDVVVDGDNGIVYWVNVVNGDTFKVMSTSYAGQTVDLNITYDDTIEIAFDELYLYVLFVSNKTIYKYNRNTVERMGSIPVPSGTSGIEVAFDEDECCIGTFCHELSTCANSFGNFTCTCNDGYTDNGTFCEEINECLRGSDNCHDNATCTNTIGSHTCKCFPGFTGNGTYCEEPSDRVSSASNSSLLDTAVIIGIVVAALVVMAMGIVACLFYRRKQGKKSSRDTDNVQNTAYEGDTPQSIEMSNTLDSQGDYEGPAKYAQLDSSLRETVDANYQSLIDEPNYELPDKDYISANDQENPSTTLNNNPGYEGHEESEYERI